ncbi:NUMOD4 domain-containing protein, partial [Nocardia mangyaensis]|uniref:NUMOD4 domain-containing protein n=1 Tax=Nocardia mangyaensis TaxID=2213200 RepID=UPI002674B2C4
FGNKEVLKTIDKYPNYQVSSLGYIYSKKTKRRLKPFISNQGYEIITLCNKGNTKKFSVHRLIADILLKEYYVDGYIVNHIDGNKVNNHADNLKWCSYSENLKHAYDTGLNKAKIGENHPSSKLNNKQINEVRDMLKSGQNYKTIADKFNVSTTLIGSINRGTRRKHD